MSDDADGDECAVGQDGSAAVQGEEGGQEEGKEQQHRHPEHQGHAQAKLLPQRHRLAPWTAEELGLKRVNRRPFCFESMKIYPAISPPLPKNESVISPLISTKRVLKMKDNRSDKFPPALPVLIHYKFKNLHIF